MMYYHPGMVHGMSQLGGYARTYAPKPSGGQLMLPSSRLALQPTTNFAGQGRQMLLPQQQKQMLHQRRQMLPQEQHQGQQMLMPKQLQQILLPHSLPPRLHPQRARSPRQCSAFDRSTKPSFGTVRSNHPTVDALASYSSSPRRAPFKVGPAQSTTPQYLGSAENLHSRRLGKLQDLPKLLHIQRLCNLKALAKTCTVEDSASTSRSTVDSASSKSQPSTTV